MKISNTSVLFLFVRVVGLFDDVLEDVLLDAEFGDALSVVVVVVLVILEVVVYFVDSGQIDLYFVLVVGVVILVTLLGMDGFVGAALSVVLFLGQLIDEDILVLLVGPERDVVLNRLLDYSVPSLCRFVVVNVLDLYLLVIALLEGDVFVAVLLFD